MTIADVNPKEIVIFKDILLTGVSAMIQTELSMIICKALLVEVKSKKKIITTKQN